MKLVHMAKMQGILGFIKEVNTDMKTRNNEKHGCGRRLLLEDMVACH